ncbi:RNase P subunit p30 family protein [Methanolobus sp. ZRKC3]|uniref:ribonuclease P protein component 3 n=1 Tax=Methanolobus sp. ZRKC3 TaxID=3125786 RepID=UPI0032532AE3
MADPRFYDLNVHLSDGGCNALEDLSFFAKHLGYSGIALEYTEKAENAGSVDLEDFEVFSAVEVYVSNASKLHGQIGKCRSKTDVIVVCGGSESINRTAVENPNVDVLVKLSTPKDNGFNHVLAKEAADNNVAISFDLGDVIQLRGGRRVHALMNFRKNLLLVRKYDVPFILTSNATSYFGMRAPRELIALAELFGMTRDEAISGLSSIPESIISRKHPPSGYIFEGVQELDSFEDVGADDS